MVVMDNSIGRDCQNTAKIGLVLRWKVFVEMIYPP